MTYSPSKKFSRTAVERDDFEKSQRELGLPLVTLPPNRVSKPAPDQGQPDDRAA